MGCCIEALSRLPSEALEHSLAAGSLGELARRRGNAAAIRPGDRDEFYGEGAEAGSLFSVPDVFL